jgi:dipeptidyl aminopeptidase/acylaminoacyl peptidase
MAYSARGEDNGELHPFRIQDSIEIAYIVNAEASTVIELRGAQPIGQPIFSPDRARFLLLTQRGVLSTNKLEATLWVFNRRTVWNYVLKKSPSKPLPQRVVKLAALSNTPVISSVRWLEDSNRIAFLGKKNSPYQQLFVADVNRGRLTAVTSRNLYVSAYDIHGKTIAYCTLLTPRSRLKSEDDVVDVTGRGLLSLLYPPAKKLEDVDEESLLKYPSTLHVERNGREIPLFFTFKGKPLRLFIPTMALAPNGKSLITVAPVSQIPSGWGGYEPWYKEDFLYLKPGNRYALDDDNLWKASQFVLVNLRNGVVSTLVDAPAGRGFAFNAPTKAMWLVDGRRAILSNTFLPYSAADETESTRRRQAPAVALVDTFTHATQPIAYLVEPPPQTKEWYRVSDVSLNEANNEVKLVYTGGGDHSGVPPPEVYGLKSEEWVKLPEPLDEPTIDLDQGVKLSVDEDLNQPPVLKGQVHEGETSIIWDPNPQLQRVAAAKVSLYEWQDKNGKSWSGLLALPPNFDPKIRYPLVIQTYGYDAKKYFADGAWTSGYGGRALAAKRIIVLQSDMSPDEDTPAEGEDQLLVFESAIDALSASGIVDRGRVGIIGFSRTCYHVLYSLTHRSDLFAAASITDGVNMSYVRYLMSMDTQDFVEETFEKVNGGIPSGTGLMNWFRSAPGFNLDKVKTPLLISAFETGQLMGQWEIYSGLRLLKKPVDMIWLRNENAPHILVQPHHRYISQEHAVDWFDFWLNGHEDPDPAKAEQYTHWRELRGLLARGKEVNRLSK